MSIVILYSKENQFQSNTALVSNTRISIDTRVNTLKHTKDIDLILRKSFMVINKLWNSCVIKFVNKDCFDLQIAVFSEKYSILIEIKFRDTTK